MEVHPTLQYICTNKINPNICIYIIYIYIYIYIYMCMCGVCKINDFQPDICLKSGDNLYCWFETLQFGCNALF